MVLTIGTAGNEPSGVGRGSSGDQVPGRGLDEDDFRGRREFEDFIGGTEADDAAAEDDYLRGCAHRDREKLLRL